MATPGTGVLPDFTTPLMFKASGAFVGSAEELFAAGGCWAKTAREMQQHAASLSALIFPVPNLAEMRAPEESSLEYNHEWDASVGDLPFFTGVLPPPCKYRVA
jgi:hypothetical protein